MKTTIKITSLLSIMSVLLLITFGFYKAIVSSYFINSPFNSILIIAGFVFACYLAYKGIKYIVSLVVCAMLFTSCHYAKSNQQVLISDDCGVNWKSVKAGESVPRGGMNPCFMKVVIPNFPMQGESAFIGNLKDRVRANVHIDYDYSIVDPLSFIKQAKYLGKANTDADEDAALEPSAFEGAENAVIDKRIKDVAKAVFITQDLVELDQAELEALLQTESNKVLEPLGVHLNFITLTFDLDEQSRQAVDVATAMKIYKSNGLEEIGKVVMSERAGATKITVETKTEIPKQD